MVTAVISTENPAVIDGDSVTLTKSGPDNIASFTGAGKVGASETGIDTWTHGNAITVFADSPNTTVGGLTIAPALGYQLDGDITETAQNIATAWDVGGGEDYYGTVLIISGVDQTTPFAGFVSEGFTAGNATALAYDALDGDTVVYVYHDTSSTSISAPTGWTVAITPPNTGTNQLDEGITMYRELTSDEDTTVIAENLSGAGSGGQHYLYIVKQVAAGGDTDVTATLDTLSITDFNTTVEALVNIDIDATTDTLSIADFNTTVTALVDLSVSATLDTLSITNFNTTVLANTEISASLDTLSITDFNATVQAGENNDIIATLDTLSITNFDASVTALVDVNIAASLDTLTITDFNAIIQVGSNTDISATSDSLSITDFDTTVSALVNTAINATSDSLTIANFAAVIVEGAPVVITATITFAANIDTIETANINTILTANINTIDSANLNEVN